ncbi:MAG: AraC family transcriptional regulator [Mycobacterium sp.]
MSPEVQMYVAQRLGPMTSDWAPLIETTDVDEATALLRPAFFPVDIAPSGADPVHIRLKAQQLPLLSIGYLHIGGGAALRLANVSGYHIAVAVAGHTVTRWPDGHPTTVTAPGSATVFAPGSQVELTWSDDCAQLGIKFAPAEVVQELEKLLDRPVHKPIEFARRLDLRAATSDSWLSLIGILAREAGRSDGLVRHRLAVANLQRLLIEGLLLTQPHNFSAALSEDDRSASDAVVKRAVELLCSHPESVWTTAELARATGVSARALQKAFGRSGKPPPMTYLRQVRLHKVHADLLDASRQRSPVAVSTVASRWGFVHLGRFAQQYRQLFGESPSHTLRLVDNHR